MARNGFYGTCDRGIYGVLWTVAGQATNVTTRGGDVATKTTCPDRQHRARARVSGENTREQPDHRSTTRENHNTGLPYAQLKGETLTSFARPPHDQLHTFPRQPAFAAPRCERSAAIAVHGQNRSFSHEAMSDVRKTCTICVIRHSWESVTRGKRGKIDLFSASDGFPWVTDNTSTLKIDYCVKCSREARLPAELTLY